MPTRIVWKIVIGSRPGSRSRPSAPSTRPLRRRTMMKPIVPISVRPRHRRRAVPGGGDALGHPPLVGEDLVGCLHHALVAGALGDAAQHLVTADLEVLKGIGET